LILVRAGLPEPELNVDIFAEGGRWIGRADQVFRDWRTIAECDGEQHRTNDRQYERYELKIEELGHAGWTVVRVRKKALLFRGAEAVERVSRALRSRGWTP
jgi:very-short-patch-repair endonuclease